jgi:hypothetical protein
MRPGETIEVPKMAVECRVGESGFPWLRQSPLGATIEFPLTEGLDG